MLSIDPAFLLLYHAITSRWGVPKSVEYFICVHKHTEKGRQENICTIQLVNVSRLSSAFRYLHFNECVHQTRNISLVVLGLAAICLAGTRLAPQVSHYSTTKKKLQLIQSWTIAPLHSLCICCSVFCNISGRLNG